MPRCLKLPENENFGGIEVSLLFFCTLNNILVVLSVTLGFY